MTNRKQHEEKKVTYKCVICGHIRGSSIIKCNDVNGHHYHILKVENKGGKS